MNDAAYYRAHSLFERSIAGCNVTYFSSPYYDVSDDSNPEDYVLSPCRAGSSSICQKSLDLLSIIGIENEILAFDRA